MEIKIETNNDRKIIINNEMIKINEYAKITMRG